MKLFCNACCSELRTVPSHTGKNHTFVLPCPKCMKVMAVANYAAGKRAGEAPPTEWREAK